MGRKGRNIRHPRFLCPPNRDVARSRVLRFLCARRPIGRNTSRAADIVARARRMSTSDLSDVETAREARAESGRAACARVLATQRDYYRVLELPRAATAADVKKRTETSRACCTRTSAMTRARRTRWRSSRRRTRRSRRRG